MGDILHANYLKEAMAQNHIDIYIYIYIFLYGTVSFWYKRVVQTRTHLIHPLKNVLFVIPTVSPVDIT